MQREVHDAVAVVVLDEQGRGVVPQHRPQGTRAGGAQRRARRVLRPVRDDQGTGAGLQDPAHVAGERPLVVDADGDRAQAQRGDEVEEAAPARVLDGDGVAGLEVGRQYPFHGVQRSRRDGHGSVRHPVGVEFGPRDAREAGVHGRVPVEHGVPVALLGGGGEDRAQGGQQSRVGVAVGDVAHSLGHLHPDVLAPRGGRFGAHAAAPAPGGLDDPALTQGAVGGGDGVRIDAEPLGQLPHGRERLPRLQLSRPHRALDARGNLRCAPPCDPILS
ncbi:hypothetical protein BC342_04555 [Streptomyces olivaceus]|nr:hypothetical protein BC342_04555 [Streptomyces olivaceus]